MAQQNNPFYVDPFGGYGQSIVQGLSGLGAALGQRQQMKQQQAILQQGQEILQRGNPGEISQFMLANPEMGQRLREAMKFRNELTDKNMKDSMLRVISGANPMEVINERVQFVTEQGGDPTDTAMEAQFIQENYADDPEGYRRYVERQFEALYPDEYTKILNNRKSSVQLMGEFGKIQERATTSVLAKPTKENAIRAIRAQQTQARQLGVPIDLSDEIAYVETLETPEQIKEWAAGQSMEAKDLLGKVQQIDLGGSIVTQIVNPVTGQAQTLGTQRKTMAPGEAARLAEDRRQFAITQSTPKFVAEAGGFVLPPDVNNPQGKIIPVAGGAQAAPKLTETQAKSTGFYNRAKEASKVIEEVGKSGKIQPSLIKRGLEAIPITGSALGMVANKFVASEAQQQVEQAQRDFVNAVLRQESGAAIGQDEFDNAVRQYFPQPGDDDKVIAQKRKNREEAIKGFQVAAGPGAAFIDSFGQVDVSSIPAGAIDMLRANPNFRQAFDDKYGKGAAKQVLGN